MSRFPYKFTAVRADDDDSGKNVVPFATVNAKDELGAPANIYTVKAGGTSSSSFILDSNGEKQIWVEPGIYQFSVAGGAYFSVFISAPNATNEELRDRATHTGAQAISTISGLQPALDEKLNQSQVKPNLLSPNDEEVPSTLAMSSAIAAVSSGEFPQGAWDADANSPSLASGIGTAGYSYEVSVAGATDLDGITAWEIGDKAIFNGTIWTRVPANAVKSVDGRTGDVILNYDTPAQAALASLPVGAKYSTKGANAVGDGGEGNFIVSATALTAVDGYSCFEHPNGTFSNLQPVNGAVDVLQFGASSGFNAAFDLAVAFCLSNGCHLNSNGNFSSTETIHIPSGNLVAKFQGTITAAIGVTPAVSVGDVGASAFSGRVENIRIRKAAAGETDEGIEFINCANAEFVSPYVENFESNFVAAPITGCRVAYCSIYDAHGINAVNHIKFIPSGGGYANENTFWGGRMQANIAVRLQYHILLDNSSGQGVGHNRFNAISIEGATGAGSCGVAAVKVISGDQNQFNMCRTEPYGTGWSSGAAYVFDSGTEANAVFDTRFDTVVLDNGQNWATTPRGRVFRTENGVTDAVVMRDRRTGPVSSAFFYDLADDYSPSGNVNFMRYYTPRTQARAGKLVELETGFGVVHLMDDAGTMLPRDNFADLGSATRRWRAIYATLPTYADNAAAGAGGLLNGAFYKTATGELRIKV